MFSFILDPREICECERIYNEQQRIRREFRERTTAGIFN